MLVIIGNKGSDIYWDEARLLHILRQNYPVQNINSAEVGNLCFKTITLVAVLGKEVIG